MRRANVQDGFTVIEVVVAAMLLVVGILGLFSLVDTANQATASARDRATGTAVARRVAEVARGIAAADLTNARVLPALKAAAPDLPDADPGDAAWTIRRRGAVFAITATVCVGDDPADGLGPATPESCAPSTHTADAQSDDYRRLTVVVSGRGGTVRQVTDVSSTSTTPVPQVTSLAMTSPAACTAECPAITGAGVTRATFQATTINSPASVNWLVGGTPVDGCPPVTATCSGSGNRWAFTWNLGLTSRDSTGNCVPGNYVTDGLYEIGAAAYERVGITAGTTSIPIELNRCQPLSPAGMQATGRDADGVPIDVEWQANAEGDVVGYRVYRGSGTSWTQVCPAAAGNVIEPGAPRTCTDTAPPAYRSSQRLYYGVAAVDRDTSGRLREGTLATQDVNTGNQAPYPPLAPEATRSGGVVRLRWTIPQREDGDASQQIESFRIYRGNGSSPSRSDRYDRELRSALCTSRECTWTDPEPPASATYWVSSVDPQLRESTLTAGLSL